MLLPRRVRRPVPIHADVLRLLVEAVGRDRPASATGQTSQQFLESFRATLHPDPDRDLGGRPDPRVRLPALVAGNSFERSGERAGPGGLLVFQRSDLLHSGIRRSHADARARTVPGGGRDGHRTWFYRCGHQLPADPVPGVLSTRGHDFAARCPSWLATNSGHAARSRGSPRRHRFARPVPRRVGTLGGRGS